MFLPKQPIVEKGRCCVNMGRNGKVANKLLYNAPVLIHKVETGSVILERTCRKSIVCTLTHYRVC